MVVNLFKINYAGSWRNSLPADSRNNDLAFFIIRSTRSMNFDSTDETAILKQFGRNNNSNSRNQSAKSAQQTDSLQNLHCHKPLNFLGCHVCLECYTRYAFKLVPRLVGLTKISLLVKFEFLQKVEAKLDGYWSSKIYFNT